MVASLGFSWYFHFLSGTEQQEVINEGSRIVHAAEEAILSYYNDITVTEFKASYFHTFHLNCRTCLFDLITGGEKWHRNHSLLSQENFTEVTLRNDVLGLIWGTTFQRQFFSPPTRKINLSTKWCFLHSLSITDNMHANPCKKDPGLLTALSAAVLLLPDCTPPSLCWIISKRWMYSVSDRSGSWVGTGDFSEVDGGNLKKEKVGFFSPHTTLQFILTQTVTQCKANSNINRHDQKLPHS